MFDQLEVLGLAHDLLITVVAEAPKSMLKLFQQNILLVELMEALTLMIEMEYEEVLLDIPNYLFYKIQIEKKFAQTLSA